MHMSNREGRMADRQSHSQSQDNMSEKASVHLENLPEPSPKV